MVDLKVSISILFTSRQRMGKEGKMATDIPVHTYNEVNTEFTNVFCYGKFVHSHQFDISYLFTVFDNKALMTLRS